MKNSLFIKVLSSNLSKKIYLLTVFFFIFCIGYSQCTAVTMGTQPQNQTVTAGNTATFTVSANGTGPFKYFWYTGSGTFIVMTTGPSYTTPALTTADNGNCYYCLITNCTNTYEVQSNTACVTVNSACTPVSMGTQPQNQTVTAGNTATFTLSPNGTGPFLYFWYTSSGTQIQGASGPSYTTPALTSANNGDCYYCLITNCNSTYEVQSNTVCVTVTCTDPTPPTGLTVSSTTGTTADVSWNSVSGSGITYEVFKNNTSCGFAFGSTNLGPTSNTSGTVTGLTPCTTYYFVVTATNSCGASGNSNCVNTTTGTIPSEPGTISGPTSICENSSNTYSVTSVTGATSYTWTMPNGWTGTSTTNTITPTTGSNGGNITVTANNTCGSSAAQTLNVTVNNTPAQPGTISGPTTVCTNSSNTYSVTSVTGATSYTWTMPNGWNGTSSTNSITSSAASSGNITVVANNSCGASTAQTLNVTVNSAPSEPGNITGNASVCVNGSNTYDVASVNGATSYTWTLPVGWTGTSTTNSITASNGSSGGNITVAANNSCGASTAQTLSVMVTTINNTATVSGPVCTATQTGATYQWINCNTRQNISGATLQTYTATQTDSYECVVTFDNCSDTTNCVTATVVNGIASIENYNFNLYPNPNSGSFVIEFNYPSPVHVQIVSSIGDQVADQMLTKSGERFDISNLAPGIYQVMILDSKQLLKVIEVVKQ